MTEAVASTKWCPMVKAANGANHTFKMGADNCWNTCITTNCMFWRWEDQVDHPGHGYCGLAGSAI